MIQEKSLKRLKQSNEQIALWINFWILLSELLKNIFIWAYLQTISQVSTTQS